MKYPGLWAAILGLASLAMAPFSAAFDQDEPGIIFEYGYTSDIMMVAGVDAGANATHYPDNVGLWSEHRGLGAVEQGRLERQLKLIQPYQENS